MRKLLAKLGQRLVEKYMTPHEALDELYKKKIGERTFTTHAEFKKLPNDQQQSFLLECVSFDNNTTLQQIFQWETEEQSLDTMRNGQNEAQFYFGKMSVYATENLRRRIHEYATLYNPQGAEVFDKYSVL